MKFVVGETVVYPHHGAAKIIEVADRTIRGEKKLYLTLEIIQKASEDTSDALATEKNKLTIQVPAENVEAVGVGRPSEGVIAETRGERVRVYRSEALLADSAAAYDGFKA